jgi:hypothetical protein
MKINKITTGFVIQQYDTTKKRYVSQSFVASSKVDYENEDGKTLYGEEMADKFGFGPWAEKEPYLPFDMVQPKERKG